MSGGTSKSDFLNIDFKTLFVNIEQDNNKNMM